MRTLATIAALAVGAWGISFAVIEGYQAYVVYVYTSPIEAIFIAAVLLNSLATCWLGIALNEFPSPIVPSHPIGAIRPRTLAAFRVLGFLLLITGLGCVFYLLFGVYLAYVIRSVLPWNDPEEALALYRGLALLITSVCACWVGVKVLRQRRTPLPLERAV